MSSYFTKQTSNANHVCADSSSTVIKNSDHRKKGMETAREVCSKRKSIDDNHEHGNDIQKSKKLHFDHNGITNFQKFFEKICTNCSILDI